MTPDAGLCGELLPPDGSRYGCDLELSASLSVAVPSPWEQGRVFSRRGDFVSYFTAIAVSAGYVDPARQIDCTAPSACSYDPEQPRSSPSHVHYSDELHRFVGPDGLAYVWGYLPERDQWFTGVGIASTAYCSVLQCNDSTLITSGVLPGP